MVDKNLLKQLTEALCQAYDQGDLDFETQVLEDLSALMASIPLKRKASFGIVSVVALYCKSLFKRVSDAFDMGLMIFEQGTDFKVVCVGLGLLSHVGVEDAKKILPYMSQGADHELWEVKEFVQIFIRKMTTYV